MKNTLRQRLIPLLAAGAVVLGMGVNAAKAEELRIGFIAPMTGIFAQIGAVRGPVSFEDRNPIENIYIKKVEKKKMFGYGKAELWNVVIKTYPNVSQYWTYGKDKFLKQPVYSRDFPPCKYFE
jgi:branched-chain amino acid transport system substrate-binding protein